MNNKSKRERGRGMSIILKKISSNKSCLKMKQTHPKDNECTVWKQGQVLLRTVWYSEKSKGFGWNRSEFQSRICCLGYLLIFIDPKFPELSKWGS